MWLCILWCDLRIHSKMHSGEKSNKCNQCDYASSGAGNSRTHFKMHSEESQTNATNGTMPALILVHWGNMWKTQWRSVIQMQPMWLCVFSCRWFEDTFEKRKVLFFAQASRVKRKILNTFLQFREEKESIEEEEENYLTLRAEWVKLFAPQPWHHSRKYWLC